ncbi:MAG: hypothetical protein H0W58_11495 [Acidobacteria bacterium]|jgi:hypothetical protein|nr:hypothetical protein [Acidobacteriota bacterium]
MKDFYEKQLAGRFDKGVIFSRGDLYDFYLEYEPELKNGTFGWRIYDLKKKDIIKSVGKGIYTICDKPQYQPFIGELSRKIAKLLAKNFSDIKYCVWESSWLGEFSNHQSGSFFTILEVEKDLMNSVFFNLKDNNVKDLFLQPGANEMEIYVQGKENPVVLKCLISRSPLQKISDKKLKINIPVLEKILTDIYCDTDIFYFYQGKELETIFENAISRYTLDFSRLLAYANRRGKEVEIKEFLRRKFSRLVGGVL